MITKCDQIQSCHVLDSKRDQEFDKAVNYDWTKRDQITKCNDTQSWHVWDDGRHVLDSKHDDKM